MLGIPKHSDQRQKIEVPEWNERENVFDETKKELHFMNTDKELKALKQKIKKEIEEQPSNHDQQFERQKKHFDNRDKWDLKRGIIVLLHIQSTNKYLRLNCTQLSEKKKYDRKPSTKEFFNSAKEINTDKSQSIISQDTINPLAKKKK